MPSEKILLALNQQDMRLLKEIADLLEVPQRQVIRWALRYYFLHGPWTAHDRGSRLRQFGVAEALEVGRLFQGEQ